MNYLIQRKNGNPSFCLVKRKPNFIFHSELDNMLKPWWKKFFGHSNTCQPKLTISDESWAFIISALKSLTLKHLKNSCTEIETLPKQKKKETKFLMINYRSSMENQFHANCEKIMFTTSQTRGQYVLTVSWVAHKTHTQTCRGISYAFTL